MEGILYRHAHLLEHQYGVAAQVTRGVRLRKIKVAHVIEGQRLVLVSEVVILQLSTHVHDKAGFFGAMEHATQTLARITLKGLAVGSANIAEHAGSTIVTRTPRQYLEGRGVRERQHVSFLGRSKALDSRAIKTNTLFKGNLKVLWADCKTLKTSQYIDEPETDKTNVALLDRAKHEVDILLIHCVSFIHSETAIACNRYCTFSYLCFGRVSEEKAARRHAAHKKSPRRSRKLHPGLYSYQSYCLIPLVL